tara:strand:- start:246 stop:1352 length:1107 start_codon:yes stop_codon:yes gene_type:complete
MNLTKLQIKTANGKYPIFIGKNILSKLRLILHENLINFNQCLVIADTNVPKKLINKVLDSLSKKKTFLHYFSANEKNKNQKSIDNILSILLNKNFNRNDCVISIGGGITGDVSGFAASIFKRGLKFVNIPTTLLSQVDSSIGGKTGINNKFGKNLIGSFYQPNLVITDINFLKSLPQREIICGYGEILKHAIIYDRKFFTYLDINGSKVLNLKSPSIEVAIFKSCSIKKQVVEADEKETGIRKILNFGHTFAHAYEATLGYSKKLNHGEAVILGIKMASKFSLLNKILSIKEFELIENHLDNLDLPRHIAKFFSKKDINKILSFMKKDKKNNTNKINLVLLKKIGSPVYKLQFDQKKIDLFLRKELTK